MKRTQAEERWRTPPRWPVRRAPRPRDELVWHYTDRRGFEGIVASHTLWATSTDSLNDSSELTFGLDDLMAHWRSIRPQLRDDAPVAEMDKWLEAACIRLRSQDTFVVCASTTVDSLVHWRSYIGDDQTQGFAIGLKDGFEFRALQPDAAEAMFQPDFVPALFWTDVTYGSRRDWRFASNYWDPYRRLVDNTLTALEALRAGRVPDVPGQMDVLDRDLLMAVLTTKHGAYSSEEECRLVVVGAPGYSWPRAGRYGPQQIVTLTAANEESEITEYSTPRVSPLPIAKVMTGPWNPPSHVPWATDFLRAHGYDATVSSSEIPTR